MVPGYYRRKTSWGANLLQNVRTANLAKKSRQYVFQRVDSICGPNILQWICVLIEISKLEDGKLKFFNVHSIFMEGNERLKLPTALIKVEDPEMQFATPVFIFLNNANLPWKGELTHRTSAGWLCLFMLSYRKTWPIQTWAIDWLPFSGHFRKSVKKCLENFETKSQTTNKSLGKI